MSSEAKVGLFTLAIVAVIVWATFQLGNISSALGGGRAYSAVVDTAHQLGNDSVVEVAGVRVGRVTSVELVEGGQRARLWMRIGDQVALHDDARVEVRTVGLLGSRYIHVVPGSPERPLLAEGAEITDTRVPMAFEQIMDELTPIIDNVGAITRELRDVLENPDVREGLPAMISALHRSADELEELVIGYETFIKDFIRNTSASSALINENLPEMFDRLFTQIDRADLVLRDMADQVTVSTDALNRMTATFEATAKDLQSIVAGIERGEGTVGALLKDEQTAQEVKQVVASINDKLARADRLQTVVQYLGTYRVPGRDGRGEGFHHTAELRLQPAWDRYYSFGVVARDEDVTSRKSTVIEIDDGAGVTSYTETRSTRQDRLLFNLQLAKRFYDVTLRGGVIESDGGVGVDYSLFRDRLWLRSEAFDFNRDGDRPRVRGWGEARLFNHLRVAVGAEDIAGRQVGPRLLFGAGITFSDDDLKLLFGSLPSVSVQ